MNRGFPILALALALALVPCTAPARSQSTAEHHSLQIGPVPGLSTQWYTAPIQTMIPLGTTVQFKHRSRGVDITWRGATEVSNDGHWSVAERRLDTVGSHVVSVRYVDRDGARIESRSELEVVDFAPERIEVSPVRVAVDPVELDEEDLNASTYQYFGSRSGSIAGARQLSPTHYVTSVLRPVHLSVEVDPAGFAPLTEWRSPGQEAALGTSRQVTYVRPGRDRIWVGPIARPQMIVLETYRVEITSHVSNLDVIPTGEPVTFTAVTDPPGHEEEITWLGSTTYGSCVPVQGKGPEFTVQFDDTWGPHPSSGVPFQWLGVKADHVEFNLDQKAGACCLLFGPFCEDQVTREQCEDDGGTYQGDGTTCDQATCPLPPTGACCQQDGSCTERTQTECQDDGGTYQGDGTTCDDTTCPPPPTGACCDPAGGCTTKTQTECQDDGGTYQGDGTTCEETACPSIDLRIFDSNEGAKAAPDDPGALCVANLNDTDGDTIIDRDDDEVVKTGDNRDEVDLMKFLIDVPVDLGGTVKMTIVSGDIKLWRKSTKETEEVFPNGMKEYAPGEVPPELWIEGRSPSETVGDIVIKAEYMGATDTVKATAVWATVEAVAHDRLTFDDLMKDDEWKDMTEPPWNVVESFDGSGLLPIRPANLGARNAILIKFQIQPPDVHKQPRVMFDGTRQSAGKIWVVNGNNVVLDEQRTFPAQDELPNDDMFQTDKSSAPNDDGEYFDCDAPGLGSDVASDDFYIFWANFKEFLRVRFDGTRPSGNLVEGSRCSPKFEWHLRHLLKDVVGKWERSDGGEDTETSSNRIGPGFLPLDQACAVEVGDATGNAGDEVDVPCRIFNLTAARQTFNWSLAIGLTGQSLTPMPASGNEGVNALTLLDVPLKVRVEPNSPLGAATLDLSASAGGPKCSETGTFTVVP